MLRIERAADMRLVREMLRADPNVFHSGGERANASRSCPITWACRPDPPGEG